jgi:hypothetical protein
MAQRLVSADERSRPRIQVSPGGGSKTATGKTHPGKVVGETESASWLGGVPSAHVVHAATDQAEVVPIFPVTPRDE